MSDEVSTLYCIRLFNRMGHVIVSLATMVTVVKFNVMKDSMVTDVNISVLAWRVWSVTLRLEHVTMTALLDSLEKIVTKVGRFSIKY